MQQERLIGDAITTTSLTHVYNDVSYSYAFLHPA